MDTNAYNAMLDEVVCSGYANKIADFLPSLVEEYDIYKILHNNVYIYTLSSITNNSMLNAFNNAIIYDYSEMRKIKDNLLNKEENL